MYDVYVIPPSCRPMVILLCECVDFVIAFLGYKTPRRIEAGSPSSNNPSVRCVSCYCKSRSSGNSCGSPYCSHRRLCDTPSIDMKFLICVALAAVAFLSLTGKTKQREEYSLLSCQLTTHVGVDFVCLRVFLHTRTYFDKCLW